MSETNRDSGDIKITQLQLYKKDKSVSISIIPQLIQMSIYEDIQQPVLYAEIELMDSINLMQDFPIVGEEMIDIEIMTPGLPQPTTYTFAVNGTSESETDSNSQYAMYTLICVSVEQIISVSKMVQRTGADIYSNIVKDILVSDLQTTKPAYIETTRGNLGNVIPNLRPLAAIDYMRKMAIGVDYDTSGFLFYETQLGFQFRTIEGLIKQNQNKYIKSFKYVPNVNSSTEGRSNIQRNILKYEIISRMNVSNQVQSGTMKSSTSGYDLVSKDVRVTNHDIQDVSTKIITTDKKARSNFSTQTVQDYGQQNADTFFIPYDSSVSNTARDTSAAARRAYSALLQQNVVRIMVYGDTSIVAGDLLNLEFPEIKGTTGTKKPDALVSGNYLITRLRHIIVQDAKSKHIISADVVKVGFIV